MTMLILLESVAISFNFVPIASATAVEEHVKNNNASKLLYSRIYNHDNNSADLWVMNDDGTEQTNLTNSPSYYQSVSWSPDGSKIAFSRARGENQGVYVMNSDGTNLKQLSTNSTAANWDPIWSPDSSKIVFRSTIDPEHTELHVTSADGTHVARVLDGRYIRYMSLSWSPDSSKMAFHIDNGTTSRIYAVNADGTGLVQLSKGNGNDYGPVWSPDGSKIAFSSYRGDTIDLYVMDADGSNERIISNISYGAADENPVWSPDGSKIVFTVLAEYYGGAKFALLHAINSDGTFLVQLTSTNPSFLGQAPQWSPDGTIIMFMGGTSNGTAIFTISPDGQDKTNLGIGGYPAWSPDGKKIAFQYGDISSMNSDIFIMNSDGSERINLTNTPAADESPPQWQPKPSKLLPQQQQNITIKAEDLANKPVQGVWTTIRATNGTLVDSGFTPISFEGVSGVSYTISVSDYDGKTFKNWEDGRGTDRTRTIIIGTENRTITAVYDTRNSLRGFAPLTFTDSSQRHLSLTVNALSLTNNQMLHMSMIIDPQQPTNNSSGTTTTYKVYATNGYQNLTFDHWSNGSKDRIRTITIGEPTTINAYYKTGTSTVSFSAHYHDVAGPGTPVCNDVISGNCGPFFGNAEKSDEGVVTGTWSQHLPRGALCGSGGPISDMITNGTTFMMTGTYTGTCDIFEPGSAVTVSGECGANSEITFTIGGMENRFVGDSTCSA